MGSNVAGREAGVLQETHQGAEAEGEAGGATGKEAIHAV